MISISDNINTCSNSEMNAGMFRLRQYIVMPNCLGLGQRKTKHTLIVYLGGYNLQHKYSVYFPFQIQMLQNFHEDVK